MNLLSSQFVKPIPYPVGQSWLDYDWYEYGDIYYDLKDWIKKRGIRVRERKGVQAFLETEGKFEISIRREWNYPNRIASFIHELVHFKLGHRVVCADDFYRETWAKQEIQCRMVTYLVCWMFYITFDVNDDVLDFVEYLPEILSPAFRATEQIVEAGIFAKVRYKKWWVKMGLVDL